jgi:DNA-binding transcriptional LysR family regulator
MTLLQIEYFLEVAKHLNFSEAAKRLYVNQPTLSRQISSMEQEMNMQLFDRRSKAIQLTPAGKTLLQGFDTVISLYRSVVQEAQNIHQGATSTLKIGVLEGLLIGDFFPKILDYFSKAYPQIQIDIRSFSFSGLLNGLYDRSLDLIFTLGMDIEDSPGIKSTVIEKSDNFLVVPSDHPKLQLPHPKLIDFKDDLFILISPNDSRAAFEGSMAACISAGFHPRYKTVDSQVTYMLWAEAGYGNIILSKRSSLINNKNVTFLRLDEIPNTTVVLAWHQELIKPNASIFKNIVSKIFAKE